VGELEGRFTRDTDSLEKTGADPDLKDSKGEGVAANASSPKLEACACGRA